MNKLLWLLIFIPFIAHAETLPGVWRGVGDLSSSRYGKFKNIPVEWTISLSSNYLVMKECWTLKPGSQGSVICSEYGYVLKGGNLYLSNNAYVGKVEDKKVELNYGANNTSVFLLAGVSGQGKFGFTNSQKNVKAKFFWNSQATNMTR